MDEFAGLRREVERLQAENARLSPLLPGNTCHFVVADFDPH